MDISNLKYVVYYVTTLYGCLHCNLYKRNLVSFISAKYASITGKIPLTSSVFFSSNLFQELFDLKTLRPFTISCRIVVIFFSVFGNGEFCFTWSIFHDVDQTNKLYSILCNFTFQPVRTIIMMKT